MKSLFSFVLLCSIICFANLSFSEGLDQEATIITASEATEVTTIDSRAHEFDASFYSKLLEASQYKQNVSVNNGCSGCCSRLGLEDRWCQKSPDMCSKHPGRCVYK